MALSWLHVCLVNAASRLHLKGTAVLPEEGTLHHGTRTNGLAGRFAQGVPLTLCGCPPGGSALGARPPGAALLPRPHFLQPVPMNSCLRGESEGVKSQERGLCQATRGPQGARAVTAPGGPGGEGRPAVMCTPARSRRSACEAAGPAGAAVRLVGRAGPWQRPLLPHPWWGPGPRGGMTSSPPELFWSYTQIFILRKPYFSIKSL